MIPPRTVAARAILIGLDFLVLVIRCDLLALGSLQDGGRSRTVLGTRCSGHLGGRSTSRSGLGSTSRRGLGTRSRRGLGRRSRSLLGRRSRHDCIGTRRLSAGFGSRSLLSLY
jgi:hypothetical protein